MSLPTPLRDPADDHGAEAVRRRRAAIEATLERRFPHLAGEPVPTAAAQGKIENLIGYAQVPVGVAGPLALETSAGPREVYVPMATTEGAMVASYSRGMKLLREAGTARARVVAEGLTQHPVCVYADALRALEAASAVAELRSEFEAIVAEVTNHGSLIDVRPEPCGRRVILCLRFHTRDAIGINMAAQAADRISARWAEATAAEARYVHGEDVEKRDHARGFVEGRGRSVVAEARLSRELLRSILRVEPEELLGILDTYRVGYARLGTHNQLVQSANGIAAVFLATGQDVAYVTESCTGLLDFWLLEDGGLGASAYLPSLLVGTVGGGSGQGTAAECLDLLGVRGAGGANVFAEILAATVLAGDLSLLASFCAHEFVSAHERLGRNRP